jgi:hypothetical protein
MERFGLLIFAVCLMAAWGADWTQWRGPSRDGQFSFSEPKSWPDKLKVKWKVTIGEGYRRYLPLVSARDCHFPVWWFAQILAGCTNIFLRGSAELFELPPALRRIEPRGRRFETLQSSAQRCHRAMSSSVR